VFSGPLAGLTYSSDDGGGAFDPTTGIWTVGTLADGATATLHVNATVAHSGELINTAFIGSSQPLDPNPANNSATVTLNAPQNADLALAASASAASVNVGEAVTLTLTLTNKGGDPSYNPRVNVVLGGANLNSAQITASEGTFDATSGVWQLGSVGNGSTQTLQFRVVPRHRGGVGLIATAVPSTPDPNTLNNKAMVTVGTH
jgi:hypothetical protein